MLPSDNFSVTSVGRENESGDIRINVSLLDKLLAISQLLQEYIVLCVSVHLANRDHPKTL